MGPQELISHTRAAAGLVNRRRRFGVLHDSGNRVRHIENKTGCQLPIGFAGVNEAGRVGHKLSGQHHLAHCRKKLIPLLSVLFRGRHVTNYAPDNVRPFLERTTLRILQRIAFADYTFGVQSQGLGLATHRWRRTSGRCRGVWGYFCCRGGVFANCCAHRFAFLVAGDTSFCGFQRRFYDYIIVDAPPLCMCSG